MIQIGQDFERRLLAGQPADVQVIADGRNSNTAGTATGYVGAVVDASTPTGGRPRPGRAGRPDHRRAPGTTRTWKRAGT